MPRTAASNSGSIRPSPSTIGKSCAWPPWNSTPSIVPVKSTCTRSPACAARSTGAYVVRCLRRTSSVRSTSCGVTSARGRVIAIVADVAELDLGIDLEHRRELERLGRRLLAALRLDARRAGDAQVLLVDRLVERRLHALGDHVGAHLRAVLLGDHSHRHLAGPEPGDLDGAREPRQPLLHFAFDVGDRHGDVQAPLERAERFEWVCMRDGILAIKIVRARSMSALLVRKGGLEPPRAAPPAPKAGASTNSATFAMRRGALAGDPAAGSAASRDAARARGIAPGAMPPGPRAESASISDRGSRSPDCDVARAAVRRESAAAHCSPRERESLVGRSLREFSGRLALAAARAIGARSSRSTGSRAPPTTSPTKATRRPPSGTPRSRVTASALDAIERGRNRRPSPVSRAGDGDARARGCRSQPFRDLLSAFAQDVDVTRYATFADARSTIAAARPIRSAACCSRCTAPTMREAVREERRDLHGAAAREFLAGRRDRLAQGPRLHAARGSRAVRRRTDRISPTASCDARWARLMAFETARTRALFDAGRALPRAPALARRPRASRGRSRAGCASSSESSAWAATSSRSGRC